MLGDFMLNETELIDKIAEIILAHIGKKNAVPAREIAKTLGIQDNDTFVNTRTLITKTMKKKQLPIGANEKWGYFLIANQTELDSYVKTLDHREKSIGDRRIRTMVYFENYYKVDLLNKTLDEFDDSDL